MAGIVFDLDGTLVESAQAVCDIANSLMAELDLPALDVAEARAYIGNGAGVFVERALKARDAYDSTQFQDQLERFMALYAAAPPEANKPMPGSGSAMRTLVSAGHRLAICTNKPMAPTRALIEAFGWESLVKVVIAGDSLPERKPDPAPLLKAAADLGQPFAFYVGDSEVDAATAEAASIPFLLFTEGYRNSPASSLKHHAAFKSFDKLPGLISAYALEIGA
jgi:phosphoglycolate phosphatase